MTEQMNDAPAVQADERVVLSKYEHPEGETTTDPAFEVERLTVYNGLVEAHEVIENGEVVGEVSEGNLTGADIGRLIPQQ